jgi:hypothetical protein
VRAYVPALAILLGGCSASELVQNLNAPPVADLSQPNYRRVVAANITTVFPKLTEFGDLEISGIRPVDHLKGRAWLTCLRLDARGNPQHYAIFIQNDKIIDFRGGIVIDQCHKETYTPFEIAGAGKKPEPQPLPLIGARPPAQSPTSDH